MAEIAETGDIAFFYRPQVDETDPDGLDDVQQLTFVLRPHDGGWRQVIVGEKQLPDPEASGHHQTWAFVDATGDDAGTLADELAAETYDTKTRGERTRPAVRPAGEGIYAIAPYRDEMRLFYELELPEQRGEVQQALNLTRQARFVLQVRNPEAGAPQGQGLDPQRRADYPQRLQERFGDRQWIGADPPELLDYEGAELLLVAAKASVPESIDDELDTDDEDASSADVFQTLELSRDEHPADPLFGRSWT